MGRVREGKVILNKAAKFNKVRLPKRFRLTEDEMNETLPTFKDRLNSMAAAFRKNKGSFDVNEKDEPIPEETQAAAKYSVLDIIKSCKLLFFSLVMCYLW